MMKFFFLCRDVVFAALVLTGFVFCLALLALVVIGVTMVELVFLVSRRRGAKEADKLTIDIEHQLCLIGGWVSAPLLDGLDKKSLRGGFGYETEP